MRKHITILALGLICLDSIAEPVQYFQTVDELITAVKKQDDGERIHYDNNGIIEGLELSSGFSTDHNLRLLSRIKSIRYLHIAGSFITTNGIRSLAEYPNLTGLGMVCGGGHTKDLVSALPCLTNLQSLELAQTSYWTNDAIYLAKMTNLVALQIGGHIPQSRDELLALTRLANLRELMLWSSDEAVKHVDASIFSRFDKLTTLLITSDLDLFAVKRVWKTPAKR